MQKKEQQPNETRENKEEVQKEQVYNDPRFEQNTQSSETDSGIDLYREEHGDLTNDNT